MVEAKRTTPSQLETQENPTADILFAHLFPGNSYPELPPIHPLNVIVSFAKAHINPISHLDRNARLLEAVRKDQEYAERRGIKWLDKLTIFLLVRNTVPTKAETFAQSFKGQSLADLLKEDEELGGVLKARLSRYHFPDTTWLAKKLGDNPYVEKPLYLIGVLKEGKPKAVIYYLEGNKPRKQKK